MAKQSNLDIRQYVFYQVFPRQYSDKQNFQGVANDLERIKSLGIDVLYLLPIHPIGMKARKGLKGSPYAIKDYYDINPEYGTMEDFDKLIDKAHKLGLKVMMDIVINHTSRDSLLTKEHPDWFYHAQNGEFANRVGDWSDITDLDYRLKEVWAYMQNMLIFWSRKVDGFRCDVAPLIPLDFWLETRDKINSTKPNFIWLTESVHPGFIKYLRDMGYECHSDGEMFQAFDICYDYDISEYMEQYLKDSKNLTRWLEEIMRQEMIYPSNYMKLRNFENHDQPRLRSQVRDEAQFINMLSMMFFIKGPTMIYAGMEYQDSKRPSLFDDDLVIWNERLSVVPLVRRLSTIVKNEMFKLGHFKLIEKNEIAVFSYESDKNILFGIFNLEGKTIVNLNVDDGIYKNLINDEHIEVKSGIIKLDNTPIIILIQKDN